MIRKKQGKNNYNSQDYLFESSLNTNNYEQNIEYSNFENTNTNYSNYKNKFESPKKKNFNEKNYNNKHRYKTNDISYIINRKENFLWKVKNIDLPELTLNLINGLIEASIECLICNDHLKEDEEIWECNKCHTIFHNTCIYDWIFKLNTNNFNTFKWSCPHCSNMTESSVDNLPVYNCYCKKFFESQKSKFFNPQLIPHGCGLYCNYVVCKHLKCRIPCHPGPHMICNVMENITCHCGRVNKDVLCGQSKAYSCEKICDKFLKCTKHKCQNICHEGDCEILLRDKKCQECIKESKIKFNSFLKQLEGKIQNEIKSDVKLTDALLNYIFDGKMPCNLHSVDVNTDNNLKILLRIIQVSGNKLVENIKTFIPVCKQEVDNNCKCENKKSKTICYKLNYQDDILKFLDLYEEKVSKVSNCTKVCKGFKSCKIHKCNKICCELMNKQITNYSLDDPNGYHVCLVECDKTLTCGLHKCENYCHRGACKPCANLIRDGIKSCTCGKTKLEPPYQCSAEPFCRFICSKDSNCEHKCKLLCHNGECPSCEEITFKLCVCKKTVINNISCGSKEIPKCTNICAEMLPCGAHFCNIVCHNHDEQFDINYFCMMQCGREQACRHKCAKRCHGEEECNQFECEGISKVNCSCNTLEKKIKCGELKKLIYNDANYVLPCGEECMKKERMRKIEECFQGLLKFNEERFKGMYKSKEEEKDTVKYVDVKYDHKMLQFAKNKLKFVINVETTIEKALKNMTIRYEIPKLDKNLYIITSEFIKTYYNIKLEKGKKSENSMNLILSDCSEAVLPSFRLSLFGLLFKNHNFVKMDNIYHPFEMSIYIKNYRFQVTEDEIDSFISLYCSKNDFYVDEIEKAVCYVHFFNRDVGEKVYNKVKNTPSQFQDCFDIYYIKKEDQKLKDLYQYLRNEQYLNMSTEERFTENVKTEKENNIRDKDGFIEIKKKKYK